MFAGSPVAGNVGISRCFQVPVGAGIPIPRIQVRVFEAGTATENVWFVHLAGGVPRHYGPVGQTPWHAIFTDLARFGLNQRQEQFFLCISSNLPLDRTGFRPTPVEIHATPASALEQPFP